MEAATLEHWAHLSHGPTLTRALCLWGWASEPAHPAEAVQAGFDHTATAARMALSPWLTRGARDA